MPSNGAKAMTNSKTTEVIINLNLAQRLIADQFPEWKNLPIKPVAESGWDNRTFHLGDDLLIRMPSAAHYASQVEKEQHWLPKLSPHLPLPIPTPIAIGKPGFGYPWHWSINRWLAGEPATTAFIPNMNDFAVSLAKFLKALQSIDPTNGPIAGPHSFYRGGSLSAYNSETRQALAVLKDKIDVASAAEIWESALNSTWQNRPVWVHGDIAHGNLLVQEGRLSAVIDFGQLAIGDPACDLSIAWTFFDADSRKIFHNELGLDKNTWIRGLAWTLWKYMIIAAGIIGSNSVEGKKCWNIINTVLQEYRLMNDEYKK